ncbi:hypothetical protein FG386_002764 [Cryptosporidium ryanae]|uniref:uncharacterized protein n=1 Tax=Cryptosporidium ryanae TaxID=515981 RepID=UPI003519F3ED|nr:hypothetical protein FG386_002764 [Cryptosporidium ryanae]
MTTIEDDKMEETTINSDSEEQMESCKSMFENSKIHKEKGNECYKMGEYENARENYEKGIKLIEKIQEEEKDIEEDQLYELKQSLQLNLSMIYLKQEEWSNAINITGEILKRDENNIKALYRRGLARMSFGMYEESREDFQTLLKLDPKNVDAQKQLRVVRQKIIEDNEKNKSGYSKMFHGGGLYLDKQKDVEKRKKEEREKRYEEYKRYVSEVKSKNSEISSDDESKKEEIIPFEEWEKKEIEKESKKASRNNNGGVENTDKSSYKGNTIISNKKNSGNFEDDVDLDDEDIKILQETKKMGYCYFKRELSEQEKEINRQFTPKLIENNNNNNNINNPLSLNSMNNVNSTLDSDKSRTGISSWNSKGTTFEDKDISEHAKLLLKDILMKNSQLKDKFDKSNDFITIVLDSIESISGEASIAMVRGTRRFLFDFSVSLKCYYTFNDDDKYSFNINVPSLTSMCNEDDVFGIKDSNIQFVGNGCDKKRDLNQIRSFIIENFSLKLLKNSVLTFIDSVNNQY